MKAKDLREGDLIRIDPVYRICDVHVDKDTGEVTLRVKLHQTVKVSGDSEIRFLGHNNDYSSIFMDMST